MFSSTTTASIDDETGGDGQRHQREIVDAVAEQVHRTKGAEDWIAAGPPPVSAWRAAIAGTRNHADEPVARPTPKLRSVSLTAAVTDCERSSAICTWTLGGRVATTCGRDLLDPPRRSV